MGHREFRFGDWQVDVDSNTLNDGATRIPLEPRAMEVLRYLCRHPGAVIPAEELLQACWGSAEFGDNPVHKAITQLRRALGDSSTEPRYIETIRKRGYRAIAEVVEAEEDGQVVWTSGSPFRGLEPFQENHAAIFFGRMQATTRLMELIEKQTLSGRAMALVLGPSGSGKTSLVRAGLMPQLMQSVVGENSPIALSCTLYMDCADLGESSLFHALAAVLIDAEFENQPLFPGESADSLSEKLASDSVDKVFASLPQHEKPIIGLFIDRLEAVFRVQEVDRNYLEHFINILQTLATGKGMLILMACRNDFYPDIIALPKLTELKSAGGHFDLTAPDGANIAQIIRLPAKIAQLSYEVDPSSGASLDDVLCDATRGSPDTLPLLQYCLNELYRQRSESGVLRFDVFRQLGGIDGAIGIRAEQIITALSPTQAAALPQVLSLLINIGDEKSAVTARSVAWSMLRNDDERDLVRSMVEARLFVSELSGEVPSFGVAHEALLRRWPRVTDWIERYRQDLQLRTRINSQAVRWLDANRSRDLLLPRGMQTTQAQLLLRNWSFGLSDHERDFITASVKRAKIVERIRVFTTLLIATLSLAIGILGVTAINAQHKAEKHRNEAEDLMSYMLGEFVEKIRPLGRLDLLDSVSSRALKFLTQAEINEADVGTLTQRAKALQVISEVNISRSNPDSASEALLAAKAVLLELNKKNNNDKALLSQLGTNSFWLGQVEFNRNNLDLAEKYLLDYKYYADLLAQLDPNNIDFWIEQSYAQNSLGSVRLLQGKLSEAANSFAESVQLKKKALLKQPNNSKLIADLANSTSWLADAKARSGQLNLAMKLYQEEQGLLLPLHRLDKTNAVWIHRLANALRHQGELYIAIGDNNSARTCLSEAERLLKKITEIDPTNKNWQLNLYTVQSKIIDANLDSSSSNQRITKLNSLSKEISTLSTLEPKRTSIYQLAARTHQTLAEALISQGNSLEAEVSLKNSFDVIRKIPREKNNVYQLDILSANYFIINAKIKQKNNSLAEQKQLCSKALDLLEKHASQTYDFNVLAPYVLARQCLKNTAGNEIKKLEEMNFRDITYINNLNLFKQSNKAI